MPLDDKFRRFATLMQGEVNAMRERQGSRVAGADAVEFDAASGLAAWMRSGNVLWRARSELIGSFSPEIGLFRWSWAGRQTELGASKIDKVYREGQRHQIGQLACESLAIEVENEADALAKIAAVLVHADGIVRREEGTRIAFYALFDGASESTASMGAVSSNPPRTGAAGSARPSPTSQLPLNEAQANAPAFRPAAVGAAYSIAPLAPGASSARRPTVSPRSIAPMAPIELSPDMHLAPAPRPSAVPAVSSAAPSAPIREPSREAFFPVAQQALAAIAVALPQGFHQALLVITLDLQESKSRFFLQLVASDDQGNLVSLDPSRELFEATGKMIAEDARSGNGRWRKLAARLSATSRGAAVDVEVK